MARENVDIIVRERGSRVVRRNIAGIGTASTAASRGVGILKSTLLTLGAGFTLIAATQTLASFSQEMSTVRAITGATESQFTSLREEAKRLGATTRFSATQAAEGATFLARAGFETGEVLESLESTLTLAQAGALDLGSAADIASNVLQGFRLSADEAQRAVDVLAKAANSSNTNVQQLGDAMKFVAPVASGLGVSLEETTAAVGALSNAGLQASMAGTGLRRVLAELESPTDKTREVLRQFGLTAEQVRVTEVGLTEALRTLRQAGVDTGTALEIFGQRGGPAFEVLSSSIGDVEAMNEAFQDSEGFAAEVARVMDDNLNGALLAAKSAAEALVIAFGDLGAESTLTGFFDGLAATLRFVAAELDNVLNAVQVVAAGIAVAFRATIASAITRATVALRAFTVALLANPFTAILTALTATVALLTVFQDRITLSADSVTTLGDVFDSVFSFMNEGLATITDFIDANVLPAIRSLGGIFGEVSLDFESFFRLVARLIDSTIGNFIGLSNVIHKAFNDALAFVEESIVSTINFFNETFNGFFGTDLPQLESQFEATGESFGDAFKRGFESSGAAEGILDSILLRADQNARERLRQEAERQESETGGGAVGGGGGEVTGVRDPEAAKVTLEDVLRDLDQQARLLGMVNSEREIQNQLLQIEGQLSDELTTSQRATLESRLREVNALQEQADLLDEIVGPQQQFIQNQAALNQLLADGRIDQEQYTDKLREMEIQALRTDESMSGGLRRGLLRVQEEFSDFGSLVEQGVTDAFRGAEDALVQFAETGKLEFGDLVDSITNDLTRLAIRKSITEPLSDFISGSVGGDSGGGGGGGGFWADLAGSLFGFARGGSFEVGAQSSLGTLSGADNRLVAFRAQDGEQVDVTPRGQKSGGDTINVTFNIQANDIESFRQAESQLYARAGQAIDRAKRRNN